MENIKFYGFDLEKMTAAQKTALFDAIKDEIDYHKNSKGTYPKKVHVYKHYIEFTGDKNPDSHLVICPTL